MQKGLTSTRKRALRAELRAGPAGNGCMLVNGCMHKQHWDMAKQSCSTGLKDMLLHSMAHVSYTYRLTCTSAWRSGQ